MIYEETKASPALSSWIAQHWRFEVEPGDGDEFEHVIVPDGTLSIRVMQSPGGAPGIAVLTGPSTKAHRVRVRRGIVYTGVRLHPSATGPLLGIDAATLADKIGPVSLFLPTVANVIDRAIASGGDGKTPAALDRSPPSDDLRIRRQRSMTKRWFGV